MIATTSLPSWTQLSSSTSSSPYIHQCNFLSSFSLSANVFQTKAPAGTPHSVVELPRRRFISRYTHSIYIVPISGSALVYACIRVEAISGGGSDASIPTNPASARFQPEFSLTGSHTGEQR